MSRRAVLALGSNVGDGVATLQGAIEALAATPGVRVAAVSSPYRTAPVGGPEQDDFVNAVALVDTLLEPRELLAACQAVEAAFHRVREVRWGPRTLDIDVIDFDGVVDGDPVLTLPHPRAAERAFVCVPWAEVDAEASMPGRGRVCDLVDALDASGVHRMESIVLVIPSGAS
ncbi:MAG: 2-amino-4-hydroxy-6-hydroxymethyldihydropteridine diphosphokinase [bacterium]